MLHGAAVQDADRDGGVDAGYDLAALYLMNLPKPKAALTCSSGGWPDNVAVGADLNGGCVGGVGGDGGGDGSGGGDGNGGGGGTDVTASMAATGAVAGIVSPLLSAPPSVASSGLGGRGLPVEAAARSLRTRRRNALRVSNMMQAIEYLEVANDRLRIAVTNAVAIAGSSREAGERARVVAGLCNALGSTTGVGVVLFLRGLLSGLERQGS
ncbi:hypothetical protein MMPV_002662 [Pyropia vietnamensis]